MITLIHKLSQQTEAVISRAVIVEIEAASIRSKYARKKAGAGPGGCKKLMGGKIGDWELLKQMEMEEREKDEAAAERTKTKAAGTRRGPRSTGSTAGASGTAQKAKVYSSPIFTAF